MKLSCNSICVLERIRKSIPPFTWESQLSPCPVWSPYQPQPGIMGLIGAQGSAAAQPQIERERERERDGHQPWSSDGGHADQIEFQALRSRYGLGGSAKHIVETEPPPPRRSGLDSGMEFTVQRLVFLL